MTVARAHLGWRPPALVLVLAGVVTAVLTATVVGAAAPLAIGDPGAVARWGLLLARVVHDVSAAATTGLLIMAAFLVPETTRTNRRVRATRLGAVAAGVWVVSGLVYVLFTFAALAGIHLSDPAYPTQLSHFVLSLEVTRLSVISLGIALVVGIASALTMSRAVMAWLAVLSLAAMLPLALAGHAAGSVDHDTAVNSMAAHLLGVAVWVGGLFALLVLRGALGRDLPVTVGRYSTLAGWAFWSVLVSGSLNAWVRLGSWSGFATPYGAVLLVKIVALVLLGYAGWRQRRSMLARLDADHRDAAAFVRLALGELVLMGVAIGAAVSLSRGVPPVTEVASTGTSRAYALTGYPDPGRLLATSWFTEWRIDWLWLGLALVAIGLYLSGVIKLNRRGDHWPALRTVVWCVGWILLVYSTSGAPGVYGRVLFSAHMVMHMVVAMLVPLFLVPAAPLTLALRSLRARHDKTWGPREVVLQVVHSRVLHAVANPVVAAALFFFSLAVFYYSPLFGLALTTHTGHVLMVVHFLLTGYLFTWVLIGIDPGPKRWSPLILLVVLFATISFHAFFGVVMMSSHTLLAPEFFTQIHLPWMTNPLADQHVAGGIAWGVGEAPTLVLALLVTLGWVRSDRAETVRKDRQADRDGDAELVAYNAQLALRRGRLEADDVARQGPRGSGGAS